MSTIRRRWPLLILLLAAACAVVRLWFLQGLVRPVRIAGGSMAESLCGARLEIQCADCGIAFRCGLEHPPLLDLAVCPNCGYARNKVRHEQVRRGQRVLIDRLAFVSRRPRRWEVAALGCPEKPSELMVKRVVGLPGERVAIRRGDLYTNGRIQRKSLRELRELAIPVSNDAFRPKLDPSLPLRWQGMLAASRWRADRDGFCYRPAADARRDNSSSPDDPDADPLDWLVYHHWPCTPNPSPPTPRTSESAVLDNDSYNQGLSRGRLNVVADVMLVCQVEVSGRGPLALLAAGDGQTFEVRIHPRDHEARLFHNGRPVAVRETAAWPAGRSVTLELALCDQQALVAIDGRVAITCCYEASDRPLPPASPLLGVGAAGLTARVRGLRVFRDVYHLDPHGLGCDWQLPRRLGDEEYFVLGDNPPVSVDSRHWPNHGLSRDLFIGKVLPPPPWLR